MKILFQGDSITDAGRNRADYHDLGEGYPKYAAALIKERHQEIEFEFINLGISGDQTKDLVERLHKDFLEVDPDIVSILIGINDVWQNAGMWLSDDVFEERYRTILSAIKDNSNAKIVIMEPFLAPSADLQHLCEDLFHKKEVIRKLAREYADVYIPTDGLLAAAYIGDDSLTYVYDGIHPTAKGAEYIGKLYADYIERLLY